jgi:hypothetical protein
MPYNRKPAYRARRNFRRWAKPFVRRRKFMNPKKLQRTRNPDDKMRFKVRVSSELKMEDFKTESDGSMFHNIYFSPFAPVSQQPVFSGNDSFSNLFYHPDCAKMLELYEHYRVSCIYTQFKRPQIPITYATQEPNPTTTIRSQSVPLGTKCMHTKVNYQPDNTTGSVQPTALLQPKLALTMPTSWEEGIDDGYRFVNHGSKSTFTRCWKPSAPIEKRWRSKLNDDSELALGGLHIRLKSNAPIDAIPNDDEQWSCADNIVILEMTTTIYLEYKNRF